MEDIGNASIEHPLRYLTDNALEEDVDQFAKDKGFSETEAKAIRRGAFVAKYADFYKVIAKSRELSDAGAPVQLTPEERVAIKNETESLFKSSKDMFSTVATCALGALTQGWDQVGPNGANLYWPRFLAANIYFNEPSKMRWIVGIVNAAPYLASGLTGWLLTDPLNSRLGRRGTIIFASLWCFASALGSAFAETWWTLLLARLCLGVGMGIKASTVPIFAAESAPTHFRGSIGLNWQFWVACGIFTGLSANLVFYHLEDQDLIWRLQLGSAIVPAVPLLILAWRAPETPRWYMKKNTKEDYRKAYNMLNRIRAVELQACRDLYFTHMQLQVEKFQFLQNRSHSSLLDEKEFEQDFFIYREGHLFSRFIELFKVGRNRRALIASCTVMLTQQLCGINLLTFYSSTLFLAAFREHPSSEKLLLPTNHTRDDTRDALLCSWTFGLINALLCLPAVKRIDTIGRRPYLLFSIFNMAWTMLAAGLCYQLRPGTLAVTLIAFFFLLFTVFYSPGQGPVPFIYASEVFPLWHREIGVSLSVAVNLFFAGLLTLFFEPLSAYLGVHHTRYTGILGLFAGLNVIAFVLVYLLVPETKQKSLEALTVVFQTTTREHMKYRSKLLKVQFKRYIMREAVEDVPDPYLDRFERKTREERHETIKGMRGRMDADDQHLDSDKE